MLSGSAFCWRRIRAGEDRERGQERRRLCPHGPGHAAARWRPVEHLGAPLGSREIGAPRLYTPAWSVETGAIELFRGDGALGLVRTLVPPRPHHPKVGSLSRRWCRRTAPMRGAGRTRRRGQGDRWLRLVLRLSPQPRRLLSRCARPAGSGAPQPPQPLPRPRTRSRPTAHIPGPTASPLNPPGSPVCGRDAVLSPLLSAGSCAAVAEGSDEGEFPVRTDGCRCAQRPSGLLSHSGRCEAPTHGVTCACSGLAPQLDLHGRLDSVCRGRRRHGGAVSVPHPATAPPGPHPFPPACPHLPPRRTTAGPTRLPQHKL